MAQVFRARHLKTNAIVAIKRVLPDVAEDQEAMQMFEDEARICVHLEHPHIARMLDFGHVDDTFFIAFEYVHGKDLRFVFDRAVRTQTEVPLDVLIYVFTRIGEGLAYAHARKDDHGEPVSIVHRDVSPQNIVLSFDGDVKLIDFGIAKAAGRLSRTQAGSIKGKFGYMSPEQVSGREVDPRTDVFSLGICMWELITRQRLFSGQNELIVLEKIKTQVTEPPSKFNPAVPPELDRIILKALAKHPAQRYRAAKELFRDLNILCETHDFVASRAEIAQYMRRTFPEASGRDVAPRQSSPSLDSFNAIAVQKHQKTFEATDELPTDTLRDIKRDANNANKQSDGQRGQPARRVSLERDINRPEDERTAVRRNDEEMMNMAAEKQGGSDLDIFEGLGKKNAAQPSRESAPPPPPSSMKTPAAQAVNPLGATALAPQTNGPQPAGPQVVRGDLAVGKKTLLGVQSPLNSGAAAAPPPRASQPVPAARASLPAVQPPPQKNLAQSGSHAVPAAAETKPAGALDVAKKGAVETLPNNAVEMDWDDDEEATHVLDRDDEKTGQGKRPSGSMAASPAPNSSRIPMAKPSAPPASSGPLSRAPGARVSQPPPIPGSAPGSGPSQRPGAVTRPATGLSAPPPPPPPPSAGFRSAPPAAMSSQPPQAQQQMQQLGAMGAPAGSFPPPSQQPPAQSQNPFQMPVQVHTAPMNMPGPSQQQQPSRPPMQSQPPAQMREQSPSLPPIQAPPQMRMVSRMMEETQMVRPASKTGLYAGIGVGALVLVIAIFALLPSKAKLAINVADAKGANVNRVDIFIDGKKECDTSPCIADVSSGAHEVKALAAAGGDPAIKAITVESRKDSTVELVVGSAGGTGIKVQGNQPGVKLSVDGKEIGTLPQDVKDLTPGDHKIRVAGSERYQPLEKNITVAQNEMQDLGNITLTVIKGKATITLGTAGAKVYLVSGSDRRDLPTFPISVDIDTSKSWTLQAMKAGFSDYNQPISFADGQAEKTFDVELQPKGAATSNAASSYTPPPVTHNTTSSAPKTPKNTDSSSDSSSSSSASSGGDATLNINSLPASAVVLDGKPLGQTPQLHVSVSAGSHTVTFINSDQGLKKTMTVNVSAGDTKPVIAKLKADN